jgi:hypothetical protein
MLLAMATGLSITAQAPGQPAIKVYPVRVGHKYGYIKIYNTFPEAIIDTVIPPRYDYIGDEYLPWNGASAGLASPYRLFEINERVGLLGPSLKEILPNKYKRIRVVAPELFAVEEDSLFALIDISGQPLLERERYEDICLADEFPGQGLTYFFVKQGQLWGLRSSTVPSLASYRFTEIERTESKGYYKVKTSESKGLWQVVDTAGRWVVKNAYEDVRVLGENLIVAKSEQHWQILRKKKPAEYQPGGDMLVTAQKVNDSLAILVLVSEQKKPEELQLWRIGASSYKISSHRMERRQAKPANEVRQFEQNRQQAFAIPWFFPLDNQYVVHNKASSSLSNVDVLIDYAGREASENYEFIIPSGRSSTYKASRRGRWGILLPGRENGLAIRCVYDTIYDFQGDLTVCMQGQKFGVLGIAGNQGYELPCFYESVSLRDSGKVQAQLEGYVVNFVFRPEEGFVEEEVFSNSILVSPNAAFAIQEAIPEVKSSAPRYTPNRQNNQPLKMWQNAEKAIIINKIRTVEPPGERAYQDTLWATRLPLAALPRRVDELDADKLLAIHDRDSPVYSPFLQAFLGQPAAAVRLFSLSEQRFLEQEKIIGYRPFDYNYLYTAFIDAEGQMGLMDVQGNALAPGGKPLRYTYIGPFMAGRARVCIGGQLMVDFKGGFEEPLKFSIASPGEFLQMFGILPLTGKQAASRGDGGIYTVSTPESPARWGYLDAHGNLVMSMDADYVLDFHWQDSTAFFLRKNKRTHWGKPDADYGIIDYKGKEIAPAQYSEIANMEGYYLVSVDSTPTFYFTQKGGELFVNPTRLRPFSEGLAQFFDAGSGLWGYLDTVGKVAIPPSFAQARPFSEGLALVADYSGRCAFIDTSGQIVFTTEVPAKGHQFIGDFKNGRCWFKASGKSWAWGCYSREGRIIITPHCYYQPDALAPLPPDVPNPLPMDFSRGAAAVAYLSPGGTPQYALIDTLGNDLSPRNKFCHIGRLDELGLAVCTDYKDQKGLINQRGEVVVKPAYAAIEGFINGFAKVKSGDGRWGLLSQHGQEALPPHYQDIGIASEGLVAVKPFGQDNWSFVDTTNLMKIRGPFEKAGVFENGLAFIEQNNGAKIINRDGVELSIKGGKLLFFSEGIFGMEDQNGLRRGQYYADVSGNNLFGRFFKEITPFQLGVAAVRRQPLNSSRGELLGAINKRGVMVVPPKFRLLHIQPDGNIITNPQRFYGILSKKGHILIPPEFDRIEQFEDAGLFRVELGEAVGYIRLAKGKADWAWGLQK